MPRDILIYPSTRHRFYDDQCREGTERRRRAYIRKGIKLVPQIYGGGQVRIRAGTENVAGIVGLATALFVQKEKENNERLRIVINLLMEFFKLMDPD